MADLSKRYYVYSTLTNDHAYTNWTLPTEVGKRPEIKVHADGFKEQITVRGGANLHTDELKTPLGVRTEITEKQWLALQENKVFQKHLKAGLVLVKDEKDDPELIARKHMEKADMSAPLTPKSEIFKDKGEDTITPVVDKTVRGRVVSAVRGVFS